MDTPRVLVMDDEETIRSVLGAMLEAAGYEVVFAVEGGEAVDRYREAFDAGHPFRAVILDLTVPSGMGGAEAVKELRAIDPDVTAIVTSGYTQDPIVAAFEAHGFKAVLNKPFRFAELETVLTRVAG